MCVIVGAHTSCVWVCERECVSVLVHEQCEYVWLCEVLCESASVHERVCVSVCERLENMIRGVGRVTHAHALSRHDSHHVPTTTTTKSRAV